MKRTIALFLTLLMVITVFGACSQKNSRRSGSGGGKSDTTPQNPIVGTWDSLDYDYYFTFNNDNTGVLHYDDGSTRDFKYELKDDTRLTLIKSADDKKDFEVVIDDDSLIIKDGDFEERFKRVPETPTKHKDKLDADPDDIIGLWELEENGVSFVITYEKGGTGSWNITVNGTKVNYDMDWETDGDEIRMTLQHNGESQTAEGTYSIEGDTLYITVDGKTEKLERVGSRMFITEIPFEYDTDGIIDDEGPVISP